MRHLPVRARLLEIAAIAAGATLATWIVVHDAAAAVVRGVEAFTNGSVTRVVVAVDGEFRYRTVASPESGAVFLDIAEATLADGATRVVPVSDRRVNGIIVIDDPKSRVVRVSVDLADGPAPRPDAKVEGSAIVLSFGEAPPVPANVRTSSPRASDSTAKVASPGASASTTKASSARASDSTAKVSSPGAGAPAATHPRSGPAARASDRSAAPARSKAESRRSVLERPLVVLDPGHGGKDPGAKAWTGEYEKDIVLDLAERVARRLRKHGDVEVVMTRSGDEYVELADRRDSSRKWGADAFVSIHANASASGAARGIETYYHSRSPAADKEVRRLARLENGGRDKRSGKAGVASASLEPGATPLLDRHRDSAHLARLVQKELVQSLGMRYETVRDLGAKEGPFFVIDDNAAPSVLVEAAFLTHREEGVRMRSEVYREQIADGVARGILAFLDHHRRSGGL